MNIPEKIDLSAIPYPSPAELAADLAKAASSMPAETQEGQAASSAEVDRLTKALVAVANQSWRMAAAVLDPETKEPKSELSPQDARRVAKALEGMRETLESLGIKVVDRKGEPFDAGLPDKVITEEPREGLSKEQIIRTLRPTIIWNQTMVQRGEIDIAVPPVKK
jgi:molecular chaperone GrpE (heat shock protein)